MIKEYTARLVSSGIEGYTLIGDGILVGADVQICDGVTLTGPCIIGSGTVLRPGAYIRGSVIIGEGCVIGNSTELKNSIIMDSAHLPHYNYVGDSVIGYRAHLGAGAICSNLKGDGCEVVIHADKDYPTGLRKVGAFVGDFCEVGCSSVLNPGTVIGRGTRVYPLTALRGVYPAECIVKGTDNVVKAT